MNDQSEQYYIDDDGYIRRRSDGYRLLSMDDDFWVAIEALGWVLYKPRREHNNEG